MTRHPPCPPGPAGLPKPLARSFPPPPRWRLRWTWLAILLPLAATPAGADFKILHWTSPQQDGSEVHVSSCLERTPHRGFLPVRVSLRNGFTRQHAWTLVFRCGHGRSPGDALVEAVYPLAVPARSTAQHDLLVPLPAQFPRGRATSLQASLIDTRTLAGGYLRAHDHNTWSTVALAPSIGSPANLDTLGRLIRARVPDVRSSEPVAILLDPGSLPPDWRALSGIDVLVVQSAEWRQLSPAVRSCVRDWVRLGSHLIVLDTTGAIPAGLAPGPEGFGTVAVLEGDGSRVPCAEIQSRLVQLRSDRLAALRDQFDRHWPVQDRFGSKSFRPEFALLLLCVFAILVGPVNFFCWADAQHRHRLILTVPLISAGASLLLMATIVLQDGFGGSGKRAAVLQVFAGPDDRSACLTQEQISRTGVLVRREFAQPPGANLSHVLLRRSRWTFFDSPPEYRATFQLQNSHWAGDWFRSRSEQGHFLQSALPTRGRIELVPGDPGQPPALVSSLDFAIGSLFYVDAAGGEWHSAQPLAPGSKIALQPSPDGRFAKFLEEQSGRFSRGTAEAIQAGPTAGRCYALVQEPAGLLVPTHPGIRWKDDSLLLITRPVHHSPAAP